MIKKRNCILSLKFLSMFALIKISSRIFIPLVVSLFIYLQLFLNGTEQSILFLYLHVFSIRSFIFIPRMFRISTLVYYYLKLLFFHCIRIESNIFVEHRWKIPIDISKVCLIASYYMYEFPILILKIK